MTVIPPKTIKLGSGPYDCQEALSDILCAVADEAHVKGWGRQEIAMAFREVANAWYLGELENTRLDDAQGFGRFEGDF